MDASINMLMINYISCNYLIQTIEQLKKKTPIARGIHIQNISMTKGKKYEKQKKDKKVKKKNEPNKKKQDKKNEKRKKEKKSKQTKQTKNNPQHIYSARSGTERLYFPPENSP